MVLRFGFVTGADPYFLKLAAQRWSEGMKKIRTVVKGRINPEKQPSSQAVNTISVMLVVGVGDVDHMKITM